MILFNIRMFHKIQNYNSGRHVSILYSTPRRWMLYQRFIMGQYYFGAEFKLSETFELMYSESFGYKPRNLQKMLHTMRRHGMHEKLKRFYEVKFICKTNKNCYDNKKFCSRHHHSYYIIIPKYPLYKTAKYIDENWYKLCN